MVCEQDDGRDCSFEEANLDSRRRSGSGPTPTRPKRSRSTRRASTTSCGTGARQAPGPHLETLHFGTEKCIVLEGFIEQIGKLAEHDPILQDESRAAAKTVLSNGGVEVCPQRGSPNHVRLFACLQESVWRRNGGPNPRCGVEGVCSAIFPFSAGPHTSVRTSRLQLRRLGVPVD